MLRNATSDEQLMEVLLAPCGSTTPGFSRALHMQLVRGISGKQFVEALDDAIKPAMKDDQPTLDAFRAFFLPRKFDNGDGFALLWKPTGTLNVVVGPSSLLPDLSNVTADGSFQSDKLARAIFGVYLGPKPISPDAKATFFKSAHAFAAEK